MFYSTYFKKSSYICSVIRKEKCKTVLQNVENKKRGNKL